MNKIEDSLYEDFVNCGLDNMSGHYEKDVCLGAMGLSGEIGEVVDIIKKNVYHSSFEYDRDELLKEMGDVLWYYFLIMAYHDMTLDEIKSKNMQKLCDRYPERYGSFESWVDN